MDNETLCTRIPTIPIAYKSGLIHQEHSVLQRFAVSYTEFHWLTSSMETRQLVMADQGPAVLFQTNVFTDYYLWNEQPVKAHC